MIGEYGEECCPVLGFTFRIKSNRGTEDYGPRLLYDKFLAFLWFSIHHTSYLFKRLLPFLFTQPILTKHRI